MTQNPNLLNAYDLSVTVRLSMSLNDRVRERLREIKAEKDVSHRDLAGFTGWSQAKVGQKLLGETEITLDELETLCFALGIAAHRSGQRSRAGVLRRDDADRITTS
jgi:transcriptional regulator with XRE-family HTH domain